MPLAQMIRDVFPILNRRFNTAGDDWRSSVYRSSGYVSYDFVCFACG